MNKVVIILALLMLSVQAKSDLDESYTYDANKNLTAESSTGTAMTGYGFDASFDDIDRVTQWDRDNATESQTWTLDKIGNWDNTTGSLAGNSFNETRTHNGVHELTAMGSNSVAYDDKGNMTTDANANTLVWDIDNHLESFGSIDFTYDALGRRLEKKTATTDTLYISNGQRVIEEYEDSGSGYALARSYVHGSYVDDVVAKVEAVSTPTVLYYHSDRQFNVRGLTDSSGDIVELYAYSVYGKQTVLDSSGVVLAGSSYNNNYGYTGRYLDDETGLWYFRARYFNDEMGRFINRDPLGYVDGMSLYNGYFAMGFAVDPFGERLPDPHPPGGSSGNYPPERRPKEGCTENWLKGPDFGISGVIKDVQLFLSTESYNSNMGIIDKNLSAKPPWVNINDAIPLFFSSLPEKIKVYGDIAMDINVKGTMECLCHCWQEGSSGGYYKETFRNQVDVDLNYKLRLGLSIEVSLREKLLK